MPRGKKTSPAGATPKPRRGRPTLSAEEKARSHNVSMNAAVQRLCAAVGDGSVSRGARIVLERAAEAQAVGDK